MASSSRAKAAPTNTQIQQKELEEKVAFLFQAFASGSAHHHSLLLELWREEHSSYLFRGLERLSPSFCVLDANRPWLCYWILHSLALLGEPIDPILGKRSISFLSRCQDSHGGYGGGPRQMPHLATTYAAVCSLITIGGKDALASINREQVLKFLLQMKDVSGGFRMHENGEIDVRGCYTAIAVAHLLDLMMPAVTTGVAEYIVSCQTHEGGIGGEPGAEAHGGYTYCGLAALVLLNQAHHLDLPRLVNWAVFRQGKVEGGFQGRVNKLVDGCYSFWQGGLFPLIQRLAEELFSHEATTNWCLNQKQHAKATSFSTVACPRQEPLHTRQNHSVVSDAGDVSAAALFPAVNDFRWKQSPGNDEERGSPIDVVQSNQAGFSEVIQMGPLFNPQALQAYILLCCQALEGGLRDKPGKASDFYHTCYCLSGLSSAQYSFSTRLGGPLLPSHVLGPYDNLLEPTHPLCNVVLAKYNDAREYFTESSGDEGKM